MNYKSLFDFFHKVETEYPVQQWMVDGIHIWPLIRIQMGAVFSAGMRNAVPSRHEQTNLGPNNLWNYMKSVPKPLVDELKLFCMDFKHRERLAPCDVVMLGDADDRNVQMPTGELMDHNLDPIYEALQTDGYRIFKFEEINSDGPRYPRWTRSYTINGMMLWAKVRRKWNKGVTKDIQIDTDLYQSIMQTFSRLQPGIEPISLEYVIYNAIYVRFLADEFQEKIKILNPRLVVLECWYSTNKMALSVAAHKMGIPVVDIQHGAIKVHHAYYNWCNVSTHGYEVMPNYIWVWGKEEFDSINCFGEKKRGLLWGGRPMDLVWYNPGGDLFRYYYDKYEKEFHHGRPVILFSLQWGTDYPNWVIDFINQSDEYTWLIRLHPFVDGSQRIFLRELKRKDNIIWESVECFPLEMLLQQVSLHITMYSGVVVDAEYAGCDSIVLHPMACEMFALQIQRGVAQYAKNREALSLAIRGILSNQENKIVVEEHRKKTYAIGKSGVRNLITIMKNQRS